MNNTILILAADTNSGGLFGSPIIMMLLMFVIFWVVLIRPQQKQRKALAAKQAGLKKGDKVVTIGGMHASVNAVSEKTVSLKLSEGIFVKYDKSAIATVLTAKADAEAKTEEKK
ncbi:preprotein translocase subunit YajC [Verrucomicrobiaceae bacterium R5-34]|uniref:Sec translocon accessory complex subunit YajC n=1 Tax=Oceaniferula flava TaxID=2800421 RepID=A0AAE2SAL4_9BACT|nr:preprotein translocase subunit YajC [Oceaniferula flavus]MBK1829711.1 preprotein translocase subunit YajC [Verrucomicrobiaceae bacterium R5-34]MBK1853897.1 preprotein translocase subunit YajC [Oceaniferula flavus]MBM1135203.1 preprotein translocase subunit YajC [Oceaniferula flavus]